MSLIHATCARESVIPCTLCGPAERSAGLVVSHPRNMCQRERHLMHLVWASREECRPSCLSSTQHVPERASSHAWAGREECRPSCLSSTQHVPDPMHLVWASREENRPSCLSSMQHVPERASSHAPCVGQQRGVPAYSCLSSMQHVPERASSHTPCVGQERGVPA